MRESLVCSLCFLSICSSITDLLLLLNLLHIVYQAAFSLISTWLDAF